MSTMKTARLWPLLILCALVAACSGAGNGASSVSSGGKASTQPLVLSLQVNPPRAWLNAAVAFTVTCQSVIGNENLTFQWTFGDGSTETTTAPSDEHTYTVAGSYTYSVTCQDGSQSSTIQSVQPLTVLPYDLNVVAAGTCSSGLQGLGWCWQRPLPTGVDLRAVRAITPLSGLAVGDSGTVLATDDGGAHWSAKFPTTSVNFLDLHATDHNHVSMMASDASVWTTPDAGLTWSSTMPTSATLDLTRASMIDSQNAWAISGGSSIVETTNGGSTWTPVNIAGGLPGGIQLNAISAAADKHVWAVGNLPPAQGQVVGTGFTANTADGVNWISGGSPLSAGMMLNTVSATSGSKCSPPGPQTDSVWMAGLAPGVFNASGVQSAQTVDNGATWTLSNSGGGSLIAAFDDATAWQTLPGVAVQYASSATNNGFGTTTTGNTGWLYPNPAYPFYQLVSLNAAVFPPINAIDSADCHSGWAVGNGGTILTTLDSGKTWIGQAAAATPSTANNLTSIVASSPTQAYVLAVDSNASADTAEVFFQLLITTDGGQHWLTDIDLINTMEFDLHGSAVQALPQLTRGQIATNGLGDFVLVGPGFVISMRSGHTFDFHTSGNDDEAASVVSPPLKTSAYTSWGYQLVSNKSLIVAAPNVFPNQAYEVWNAASVSALSAWVIDGLGDVIEQGTPLRYGGQQAPNGGWTLVAGAASLPHQPAKVPPPAGGQAIAAIDLSSGIVAVIVGSKGLITRSVDMGSTWVTAAPPTNEDLQAIAIVADGPSAGIGWAVGTGATLLRTTDAGASWSPQTWSDPTISQANVAFTAISTLDGKAAWVVAQESNCSKDCGFVIRTDDGGLTWSRQKTGADGLNSVLMIDANSGWLVGRNGKILKTVTGGVVPPLGPG